MSGAKSAELLVGGFDAVDNITLQLVSALAFLANELRSSTLFNNLDLNTEFDFPSDNQELFFNVISAQAINIIPFVLTHIFNSDGSQDPIFLTDEIREIMDSAEVKDGFPLRIEDFFYLDSNQNIVFSLWFRGKIYKQIRFDGAGNWISTSSIFYNKEHIFECVRQGADETIFRVVDNNEIYLFTEAARESFDKLEVRVDAEGFTSHLVRQILTDSEDFPICIEDIEDLSNPISRKILGYKDSLYPQARQLSQKVLTIEVYYNDDESGFIAETNIDAFSIDTKRNLSTSSLSKFIRFYDDMFEESAGELVRNILKHALVYRCLAQTDILTTLPTKLMIHLNYRSTIDIEVEYDKRGYPFSVTFLGKWYKVFEVSATPDGRVDLYLDKVRKKSVSFTVVEGFPEQISIKNMY